MADKHEVSGSSLSLACAAAIDVWLELLGKCISSADRARHIGYGWRARRLISHAVDAPPFKCFSAVAPQDDTGVATLTALSKGDDHLSGPANELHHSNKLCAVEVQRAFARSSFFCFGLSTVSPADTGKHSACAAYVKRAGRVSDARHDAAVRPLRGYRHRVGHRHALVHEFARRGCTASDTERRRHNHKPKADNAAHVFPCCDRHRPR